jgi:hypothetical protein
MRRLIVSFCIAKYSFWQVFAEFSSVSKHHAEQVAAFGL